MSKYSSLCFCLLINRNFTETFCRPKIRIVSGNLKKCPKHYFSKNKGKVSLISNLCQQSISLLFVCLPPKRFSPLFSDRVCWDFKQVFCFVLYCFYANTLFIFRFSPHLANCTIEWMAHGRETLSVSFILFAYLFCGNFMFVSVFC